MYGPGRAATSRMVTMLPYCTSSTHPMLLNYPQFLHLFSKPGARPAASNQLSCLLRTCARASVLLLSLTGPLPLMTEFSPDYFGQSLLVPAKTKLVREGETAQHLYFIRQGCLRAWHPRKGTELTVQFFVEGETAAALESFLHAQPSLLTLEALEDCELTALSKADFEHLMATAPAFREWFYQTAITKLLAHTHRLLSFIQHSPQERYAELVAQQPHLLQRVAQHYLASYLGITPVSLSRIRSRKSPVS